MADGGYHNLPAKPTDQTTASIGGATGRDVTSPADDLRALLADRATSAMSVWIYDHGPNVLALLDAAQALDKRIPDRWQTYPEFAALAAAVRALTEPRP